MHVHANPTRLKIHACKHTQDDKPQFGHLQSIIFHINLHTQNYTT